jgi:hypothetical protein
MLPNFAGRNVLAPSPAWRLSGREGRSRGAGGLLQTKVAGAGRARAFRGAA